MESSLLCVTDSVTHVQVTLEGSSHSPTPSPLLACPRYGESGALERSGSSPKVTETVELRLVPTPSDFRTCPLNHRTDVCTGSLQGHSRSLGTCQCCPSPCLVAFSWYYAIPQASAPTQGTRRAAPARHRGRLPPSVSVP